MRSYNIAGVLLAASLLIVSQQSADAFQTISRPKAIALENQRVRLQSSKEDEIARLEEQLKQLKEEAATYIDDEPEKEEAEDTKEVLIDLFLSEKWKEEEAAESSEGGGVGLTGILAGVGLALFFAIFAQVPVGQEDLSKYSAIKAPTEQIDLGDLNRARKSGDL